MKSLGMKVLVGVTRGVLRTVRFSLYVLLLMLGRLLSPVVGFAILVGSVVFLFCFVFRPDLSTPMWAGASLAAGAVTVSVLYDAALRIVAPNDVVIMSEV